MRLYLFIAAMTLWAWPAFSQSPLEELERRLESGAAAPREPGFLGVTADDRGREGRGLQVEAVRPDSPAEAAGLRVGDLLIELERRPLRSLDDLGAILQFRAAGESVNLTFERDGKRHVVTARLAARPAEAAAPKAGEREEPFLPPAVENVVPFPKPAAASPRDALEALRREASELRRRLEDLERRLAELETRLAPPERP